MPSSTLLSSAQPILLTKPEAARLLNICPNTLDALVRRGEIRCIKLSGNHKAGCRYSRAELEAWVAAKLAAVSEHPTEPKGVGL